MGTGTKERLKALVEALGVPLGSLTPEAGLDLMIRFYREVPGGQLSFSWCNVCLFGYGQEEFGFEFHRSFAPHPDKAQEYTPAVHLFFKIGPRSVAGDYPWGPFGCDGPEDLESFRSQVEESPAFQAWGRSRTAGVVLIDDIEPWMYALFDWWGVRDPSRPVASMTEEEWETSDDVRLMLRWFRQEWQGDEAERDRLLQRYFFACCRRIWKLLPSEGSRVGVEVAEREIEGRATRQEIGRAAWDAEGWSFYLDDSDWVPDHQDPEQNERWNRFEAERQACIAILVKEVEAIPLEELGQMVRLAEGEIPSPRKLLADAADFAHKSIVYPGMKPQEGIEVYRQFFSAPLLREFVNNPARPTSDRPPA